MDLNGKPKTFTHNHHGLGNRGSSNNLGMNNRGQKFQGMGGPNLTASNTHFSGPGQYEYSDNQ